MINASILSKLIRNCGKNSNLAFVSFFATIFYICLVWYEVLISWSSIQL